MASSPRGNGTSTGGRESVIGRRELGEVIALGDDDVRPPVSVEVDPARLGDPSLECRGIAGTSTGQDRSAGHRLLKRGFLGWLRRGGPAEMTEISYHHHCFQPLIVQHTIWL